MGPCAGRAAAGPAGAPQKLRTDDLVTPLGLDDQTPHFAWQLNDSRQGARQSAYQLQVATKRELLVSGKPDAWDSGRIASDQSLGVLYHGAALASSTRYYWWLTAWDKDGKPYPASEINWWETGLLGQENWQANHAQWIGYQTWEESAVRIAGASWIATADAKELAGIKGAEQHIAYRLPFTIEGPVQHALLFVTGEDVASAWINGAQVTKGEPLPPWKQFPWKKYKQIDVTSQVRNGGNLLAVEITHYVENPNGMATGDTPPMSATLLV
jgi:alpha-L-rhamnosidase